MKTWIFAALLVGAVACEKKEPAPAAPAADNKPAAAVEAPKDVSPVAVSAEGSKFDPPVAIAAMPKGAWYCDMDTVHYARMTEGDGRCGICKMKLKHRE